MEMIPSMGLRLGRYDKMRARLIYQCQIDDDFHFPIILTYTILANQTPIISQPKTAQTITKQQAFRKKNSVQ